MTAGPVRATSAEAREGTGSQDRTLHGRRTGRPLRHAQASRVERLLPMLEIPADGPLNPETLFGPGISDLRLEIGFGSGEHLAAEAERQPETGFIGCEPFRNGLAKMVDHIEARGLRNVRLHAGDARLLIDRLPARSLAGVDLLYPDPWPKRRHRKRRFVCDENLTRLARVLHHGALLRVATDIDDYAGWTLARILRSPNFAWSARDAADWTTPWPEWTPTRYEAKALRAGRKPVYLTFVATAP